MTKICLPSKPLLPSPCGLTLFSLEAWGWKLAASPICGATFFIHSRIKVQFFTKPQIHDQQFRLSTSHQRLSISQEQCQRCGSSLSPVRMAFGAPATKVILTGLEMESVPFHGHSWMPLDKEEVRRVTSTGEGLKVPRVDPDSSGPPKATTNHK